MQKLIIGCGYLGRRVAVAWLKRGDDVTVLTRSEKHAREFDRMGFTPIVGDVTDVKSLSALSGLPETGTVLFAVGFDRNAGPSQRDVYVTGLENVLRALPGRFQRFLHISSTSVYGQQEGEWVDELSTCTPVRNGGRVCLQAERVLQQFVESGEESESGEKREFGQQRPGDSTPSVNILRLAGLYGPGRLLRRLCEIRSRTAVGGNPQSFLNLIHVDDAVAAVLACEERGKPGSIYLISDDRPLRRREYYETLAHFANAEPPPFSHVVNRDNPHFASLNKRCCNARMHSELQVELVYPNCQSGLRQALATEDPQIDGNEFSRDDR